MRHLGQQIPRSAGSWAAAILCLATAAPAAQKAPPDPAFGGTTRVVEVRLPLHVVDKSGQPIRGLTASDFRIVDGNRHREVLGFQVIDLETLAPDAGRGWSRQALEGVARRHFLLMFDLSFAQPTAIVRARVAARDLVLNDLHPTDLVAVGTHSTERGARLLVNFTTDRAQVARAIDSLGTSGLAGAVAHEQNRFLVDGTEQPTDSITPSPEQTSRSVSANRRADSDLTLWVLDKEMEKAGRGQSEGEVASWAASLGELARMLAAVPGRKQVLYFSEGFDGQLLFGREQSIVDTGERDQEAGQITRRHWSTATDDRFGSTGLLSHVNRMLEQFRRADCVLQTVDIAGLAETDRAKDRVRKARHHTLFYLARETGGEMFGDSNELRQQMAAVLERSAVTYLVTFAANDVPEDGAFRPLKIKAALPAGGRLLAPRGYHAPRPFAELHPIERGLLASEALAAAVAVSEVDLNVLAAPFSAGEGPAYVPVIIEVPGERLLEGMKGDQLPLELYVYAIDELGEMRDFFTQILGLDLAGTRQRFEQAGAKFYGHLSLPPGSYQLKVLVRNGLTGRSGVAVSNLAVPDFRLAQAILLPPFFIETEASWTLIRERTDDSDDSVVYPFTVGGEPFIPAARPHIASGTSAELCLVVYNPWEGEMEIDGVVLTAEGGFADGGEIAAVQRVPTGIEGLVKLTATFLPTDLAPGEYRLQIEIRDPETGLSEVSSVAFRKLSG